MILYIIRPIRSNPAVCPSGLKVYVGSNDKNIYCFNAADGAERWRLKTGAEVSGGFAVSEDGKVVSVTILPPPSTSAPFIHFRGFFFIISSRLHSCSYVCYMYAVFTFL